jgi:hypothetical protein
MVRTYGLTYVALAVRDAERSLSRGERVGIYAADLVTRSGE